jgi:beta-lactamase class A
MKKILLTIFILAILVVAISGTAFLAWHTFKQKPLPEAPKSSVNEEELKAKRKEKQEVLIETIKEIFNQESPDTSFSLGVYDLNRKEYFGYNDTNPQHAASVSKVLTGVMLLDKVDKGEIKLSDQMGAYNVEFQLEKLINISNEPSWALIDEKLGIEPQNVFAKERLGLSSVDMNNNLMSVKDVTTLLTMLAQKKILSESSRTRLFSYMQKTESEDLFSPAFTKNNVTFYHKTGKYLGEGHDAAIVKHKKNPFVLVVFSDNNTNPDLITRGAALTKVAQTVLEYFDEVK